MIDPPEAGYKRAIELLKRDYGQSTIIAASYREKAERWPRIYPGDKEALRKISIFLTNCCRTKMSNPDMRNVDNYDFLRMLVKKLPRHIQQKWIEKMGKYREIDHRPPTLEDLDQFVGKISRNENDPRVAGLGYQNDQGKGDCESRKNHKGYAK